MKRWLGSLLLSAALMLPASAWAGPGGYGGYSASTGSTSATFAQPTFPTFVATPHVAEIAEVVWTSTPTAHPSGLSVSSGWTLIEGHAQNTGGANYFIEYYRHCYAAGDPALTMSWSSSAGYNGLIYWTTDAACNSANDNFVDVTSWQQDSAGNFTFAQKTPASANEDVLYIGYQTTVFPWTGGVMALQQDNHFAGVTYFLGYVATNGTNRSPAGSTGGAAGVASTLYEILIKPTAFPAYPKVHGISFLQQGATTSPSWTVNGSPGLAVATGDAVVLMVSVNNGGGYSSGLTGFSQIRTDFRGNCCSFSNQEAFCKTGSSGDTTYSATWNQSSVIKSWLMSIQGSGCPPSANAGIANNTSTNSLTSPTVSLTSSLPQIVMQVFSKSLHGENGFSGAQPDFAPINSLNLSNPAVAPVFDLFSLGTGLSTAHTDNYTSGSDFGAVEVLAMPNALPTPTPSVDSVTDWGIRRGGW